MKKLSVILGVVVMSVSMGSALASETCNVSSIKLNNLVFKREFRADLEDVLVARGYTVDESQVGLTVSYRSVSRGKNFKSTLSIWNELGEKEWSVSTRTGNRQSLINAIPQCTH